MEYKEYLSAHGLDNEYVEKNWGWSLIDGSINIPAYNKDGKLHHNNKRLLEGNIKFLTDPGTHPSLYGVHMIAKQKSVVYCEGQPDCVKLWQEGIPAVTSTGGVKKFDESMAQHLKDKNVYICLDSDKAGKEMVEKSYKVISQYAKTTKIISLPKEFKDVSEFFVAGLDKSDFSYLIDQAASSVDKWLVANAPPEHRIESVSELLEADLPPEQWIIDKLVPWSGFSVIAGEEATGKSFYALSMAKSAVTGEAWIGQYKVEAKCKVLFLDKENERIIAQDRARGLQMDKCGDNIFRIVRPELFEFADKKGEFSQFAKYVSAFVKANDIQLIIIDSLIDFIVGDENSGADTQGFFSALREMFPQRSVMFLAHYGKPYKGQKRTPTQMIAGSRNIGAQITSGLAVQRSEYATNEFILQSIKSRNSINDKTKFKVVLHHSKDPKNKDRTLVIGIEYGGEVEDKVLEVNTAMQLITDAVKSSGQLGVSRQNAIELVKDSGISEETAKRSIAQIKATGEFDYRENGNGKQKSFYIKLVQNIYDKN